MLKSYLLVIGVTLIVLILLVAGLGIKVLLKRNGTFTKSCSTVNPETGEKMGCTCGHQTVETCENKEK